MKLIILITLIMLVTEAFAQVQQGTWNVHFSSSSLLYLSERHCDEHE